MTATKKKPTNVKKPINKEVKPKEIVLPKKTSDLLAAKILSIPAIRETFLIHMDAIGEDMLNYKLNMEFKMIELTEEEKQNIQKNINSQTK